jgi:hypothetical protein
MSRWLLFLIAIAIGAAAGLYYGWVLNPVKYVDMTPDSLRIDYKTDYVLMVAEAYHTEGDLAVAVRRLAVLGDTPPAEIVANATLYAAQHGWPETDLVQIKTLGDALQSWNPVLGVPTP